MQPCMEYGTLTCMSSAVTPRKRLDEVQGRVLKLVETDKHQQPAPVTSLEHRSDVSVLVVCNKTQVQGIPNLDRLRLPPRLV